MDNEKRHVAYKKPQALEEVLKRLEDLLSPVEDLARKQIGTSLPGNPRVYIMGCARSGTTLVYQSLAASGNFVFPTNLMSRFYYAPLLGSLIQKVLVEYDFKKEIFDQANAILFESNLGKTKGPLAPHEFWYYWRKHFPVLDHQKINPAAYDPENGKNFVQGLKALQADNRKPMVLKGMYLNWDIGFLDSIDDNAFFLNVFRDPVDNAVSLLNARKSYFGNYTEWYSFKPYGYEKVLRLSPEHQTLWQVLSTNKTIVEQCNLLPGANFLSIDYRDFCKTPMQLFPKLAERLKIESFSLPSLTPFQYKTGGRDGRIDWERIEQEIHPLL